MLVPQKKNERKTQIIPECFPFTPMYNFLVSETEPKGCVCVRRGGGGGERRKGKRERDLIEYNRNWLMYAIEAEKSFDMLSTRWKSKEVGDIT